jgi:hypothetical protein
MLRVIFTILVYQSGKLDEIVQTDVHEFPGSQELANALVVFAARQSKNFFDTTVRELWINKRDAIKWPKVDKGLGPETNLIISNIQVLSESEGNRGNWWDTNFRQGDKIVLINDQTGRKSPIGSVVGIEMGSVIASVGGERIIFDGRVSQSEFKGQTIFGPCTIEIVEGENRCSHCGARNQEGDFCSKCGKALS